MADDGERGGFVRIDPSLGRRLKAVAALRGQRIQDVLSEIVRGPLRKIEDEAVSRYASGERPVRTPAK
jgi:hypothetical protein